MDIFSSLESGEHEQLVFCTDPTTGLQAVIAIHSTVLGPALGGTRLWSYPTESDAIEDALRLSRGMTYKAAVADLNLGGGKAVIMTSPKTKFTRPLFNAYGEHIDRLGGTYITAEDVGTTEQAMEWIKEKTPFVTGINQEKGGSGDPSPFTALGVYMGIKAAAKYMYGSDSLQGKTVLVQGAGQVAQYLCGHLIKEEVKIKITDIVQDKALRVAKTCNATVVDPHNLYDEECDIFSPAALGGIINDSTIPKLRCQIVAGGANNQLLDENRHEQMLQERHILYIPDFVINAGGLINVAIELEGYDKNLATQRVEEIYNRILKVIDIAKSDKIGLNQAAIFLANQRLQKNDLLD